MNQIVPSHASSASTFSSPSSASRTSSFREHWHRQLLQDAEDAACSEESQSSSQRHKRPPDMLRCQPGASPASGGIAPPPPQALALDLARACAALGCELRKLDDNIQWVEEVFAPSLHGTA